MKPDRIREHGIRAGLGEGWRWGLAAAALLAVVGGAWCGSTANTPTGAGTIPGATSSGSAGATSSGSSGAGGGQTTTGSGSGATGGAASSGGATSGASADAASTGGGAGGVTGSDGGAGAGTGASADAGAVASSGCNSASGPTASPQTINVTDKTGAMLARQFYFSLPSGYDPTHPYPLVFAWHYAGGQAATIAGTGFSGHYYGIQPNFANAIYVAPQGLTGPTMADGGPGQTGWPNTNGQDIAFARAMVTWFESNFCVDTSRLMSAGFSYGAIMTHTIGCEMPDVFRALGVMSGALFDFGSTCGTHEVAAWATHGTADPMVAYDAGVAAIGRIAALDHCASTTHAVTPSPCVQYDGCDTGYPVVWCSVAGEGHTIPTFAASAIASFFAQF